MRRNLLTRSIFAVLFAPLIVLIGAGAAMAAGGGAALPWDGPMQTIMNDISGPTARVISIIAIVIAGAALIFGEDLGQFARRLMLIVLALALIVGAAGFLGALNFGAGASF